MLAILAVILLVYLLFGAIGLGGYGAGVGPGEGVGDEEDGDDGDDGFELDDLGEGDGEPGFSSLSPTNRTFLRTASFDRYDGDRWTKTTEPVDTAADTTARESAASEQVFRAESPVVGAPHRWRPQAPPADTTPSASKYEDGDVVPDRPLLAGEGYGVPSTPSSVHQVDLDKPPDPGSIVEARYTNLPADLDPAVEEFAGEVAGDSASTFDLVESVVVYLNRNREYSLDADPEPCPAENPPETPGDVEPPGEVEGYVEKFLFCLDRGHELHFASASAVLLRSQEVPVRVATGFEVRDGEITRRNANHWLEVYTDGDWWTVYPTSYVHREERFHDEGEPTAEASAEYEPIEADVEIPDDVRPGETVEVDVSDDGEPVEDVLLKTDGRTAVEDRETAVHSTVPVTDADGEALITMPYSANMEISTVRVEQPPTALAAPSLELQHSIELTDTLYYSVDDGVDLSFQHPEAEHRSLPTEAEVEVEPDPVPGTTSKAAAHVEDVAVDGGVYSVDGEPVDVADADGAAWFTTPYEEFHLEVERGDVHGEANVTPVLDGDLTIEGEARPLTPLPVEFTVERHPVPNASVYVDGDLDTETGAEGNASVEAPDAVEFTLMAKRGDVEDEVEVNMTSFYQEMELTYSGVRAPALPLTPRVESDGDPVRNAELRWDEGGWRAVGSGGGATYFAPLNPRRSEVDVEARAQGYTAEATVEIPLVNRVLAVLLPLSFAVAALYRLQPWNTQARRSLRSMASNARETAADGPRELLRRVGGFIRRLLAHVEHAAVSAIEASVAAASAAVYAAAGGLAWTAKTAVEAASRFPSAAAWTAVAAATLLKHVAVLLPRLVTSAFTFTGAVVASLPRRALDVLKRILSRDDSSDGGDERSGDRHGVEDVVAWAWRRLTAVVDADASMTPAEVADAAVERGLPAEPVTVLTELFRRVRYGGVEQTEDVKREARQQVERIEEDAASFEEMAGEPQEGGG